MKDFVRANLLKDKGEKVGMCAFLARQYEEQNVEIDPWLDGITINFHKWKRNSQMIILEMQLIGMMNEQTQRTYRYPIPYTAQVVIKLDGLTHKEFFDKYNQDMVFLENYTECLQSVIEENKKDVEECRKMARIMTNN